MLLVVIHDLYIQCLYNVMICMSTYNNLSKCKIIVIAFT